MIEREAFKARSGATISFGALGFGSAPLGNMNRALSEDEADATLAAAWSSGIRYFDTAPLYGHGLSETRLGRALRSKEGFVVSTKVGRLLEPCAPGGEDSGIFKNVPHLRVRFDYSYGGVMRSYEESLARLGRDRVDVLLVHDVDGFTHGGLAQSEARIRELIDRGGWRALSELRGSGAVAAIGAGVNEWEPCARLLELVDPDLFLLAGRYTLLDQTALSFMDSCAYRGVGVIVGGPFNSGILVGKPSYNYSVVPPDIVSRASALEAVCKSHDAPLAAVALQFPLGHPAVVTVIPGAQTAEEVHANAGVLGFPIPGALWTELKAKELIDASAPVPETARC
jgi:D-threo-aldose 1-dehydrogenase